jgi:hypothetical protein
MTDKEFADYLRARRSTSQADADRAAAIHRGIKVRYSSPDDRHTPAAH